MEVNHSESYAELKSMYDELQSYLDSVLLEPEDEVILLKCEKLGEQVYAYNVAIIEGNSSLHSAKSESIRALIEQAKTAKEALKKTEDKVKTLAKVAKAIDKVLEQLAKWF
ncbi:hypothetical protein ACXR5E_002452 [Vibrio mimicus]